MFQSEEPVGCGNSRWRDLGVHTLLASPTPCCECPHPNQSWDNLTHLPVQELPPHLRFNTDSLVVVIVYSMLFVVAAIGNLSVFITLIRSRHRKSRMSLIMTHLTIADLIVTFLMIPLEVRLIWLGVREVFVAVTLAL